MNNHCKYDSARLNSNTDMTIGKPILFKTLQEYVGEDVGVWAWIRERSVHRKACGFGVMVKGRVPKWCRCGVDGCGGRETEGVEGRFGDEEGGRVKVEGFLENECERVGGVVAELMV